MPPATAASTTSLTLVPCVRFTSRRSASGRSHPRQAAQWRERPVEHARRCAAERVAQRTGHAQQRRRRCPARRPRASAPRAGGQRSSPSCSPRGRVRRARAGAPRWAPAAVASRRARTRRRLTRRVQQHRAEFDRGDAVDHAVVGLAHDRERRRIRVPGRSTSPTAGGRGAAASTSPGRPDRATGPAPSRRGGRSRRPGRRSTRACARRAAPARASGDSAARAPTRRSMWRRSCAKLGSRRPRPTRELRDPAHVHVRAGRLHCEERSIQSGHPRAAHRDQLQSSSRGAGASGPPRDAGARHAVRRAGARKLAPAPVGGERELHQPIEVRAQRRRRDPARAQRHAGATVVVCDVHVEVREERLTAPQRVPVALVAGAAYEQRVHARGDTAAGRSGAGRGA